MVDMIQAQTMRVNYSEVVRVVALAVSLTAAECSSSSEHQSEVTLPNGITCKSETSGSFMHTSRSLICIDSNGKVIGSYSSD
jgi:hypothetical protein